MESRKSKRGSILIYILITATMGSVILLGLLTFIVSRNQNSKYAASREQALELAESGIYWYRWYLAHNVEGKTVQQKKDFWASGTAVGTQVDGYTASESDPEGGEFGKYKLEVTPPVVGSTIVTVKSTGWTDKAPEVKRTIQVRFRQPAWCEYAVVADDFMRFGEGTEVFGMLHSNQGIRFDGIAHNLVTSSVPSFQDPDHSGGPEFGVHTHVNIPPQTGVNDNFRPLEGPPNPLQIRNDVFEAGRKVSQPVKNFNSLVADFNLMKEQSNGGGLYLGQATATVQFNCRNVRTRVGGRWVRIWTCDESNVPVKGYHIILKNDHTMDVSMVLGFDSSSYQINPTVTVRYGGHNYTVDGELPAVNYPVPGNGVVFVENFTWVEGVVNGDHITIAAGDLSPTPVYKDIYINRDILYTDKVGDDSDGPDILGLIAQNNISVGLYSDTDLEIDGALLAQKGRVGRDYYAGNHRNSITVYGSIATKQRYGFAWTDGTGYDIRNLYFDNNLIYYPPPYFPVGDKYQIDLWQEL